MASTKKMIGFGTTISMKATTASTTTYTVLAGLISAPGPDGTADDIDTSTIDNSTDSDLRNFKSYARGQVDPGEMTLTLSYGSTDATSKQLGTLYKSGDNQDWKVTFPSTTATAETFEGYVKSMGRELEKDSMIRRAVGIKVTGWPGFPTT